MSCDPEVAFLPELFEVKEELGWAMEMGDPPSKVLLEEKGSHPRDKDRSHDDLLFFEQSEWQSQSSDGTPSGARLILPLDGEPDSIPNSESPII